MATTAALPGRINAFVRWVVRTPWPLFSLSMLQAEVIGALFVLGFLRYALPPEDRIHLQDLPAVNLAIFVTTIIVLFFATWLVNLLLLMPVFRWQRRDNLLTESDPSTTELARSRALRMPFYRTVTGGVAWFIGGAVFIESIFNWPGMGLLMVTAVRARDYPVIMGAALVIGAFVIVLNLLTDMAYAVIDPRIEVH